MKRKKLLALAPLLAIVVFAVMPAAAQAAPHWFKNGAILEEGELGDSSSSGLDTIAWGTLTLGNPTLGALKCENIFAGDAKNPTGGGAGQASVDSFTPFDCTSAPCEGAGGHLEVIPEGLTKFGEWTAELVEEGGVIKLKTGNKEEASKTKIQFEVICAAAAIAIKFHGELSPKADNGSEIGVAPSKLTFSAASGTLESTAGPGEVTGKLKSMGYEGQELITAK